MDYRLCVGVRVLITKSEIFCAYLCLCVCVCVCERERERESEREILPFNLRLLTCLNPNCSNHWPKTNICESFPTSSPNSLF